MIKPKQQQQQYKMQNYKFRETKEQQKKKHFSINNKKSLFLLFIFHILQTN